MINYNQLESEIMSDPESLGYAEYVSSGNDQAIANLLNQDPSSFSPPKAWTYSQPYVPIASVLLWAANSGALTALSAGATNTNGAIASACQAALKLFDLPSITTFNPLGPNESSLLSGLVAATILTTSQVSSLESLASLPASRAQCLFDGSVTINDISKALRGN